MAVVIADWNCASSIRHSGTLLRMNRKPSGGIAVGPAGAGTPTTNANMRLNFAGQRVDCLPVPCLVRGKLPPGEHPVTWPDLVTVFGQGSIKRKLITEGLRQFGLMLRGAGGKWLFVDGSFTTDRQRPGDWDGCFLSAGIDWQTADPRLKDIKANRTSLKKSYWCDVFAAETIDRDTGKPFREFFQQERTGKPKGILVLDLETVI